MTSAWEVKLSPYFVKKYLRSVYLCRSGHSGSESWPQLCKHEDLEVDKKKPVLYVGRESGNLKSMIYIFSQVLISF